MRKGDFQPEQIKDGSRKGRQVFGLPTGLSGYPAAFVLSGLHWRGIKPFGFSPQEMTAAFPFTIVN